MTDGARQARTAALHRFLREARDMFPPPDPDAPCRCHKCQAAEERERS